MGEVCVPGSDVPCDEGFTCKVTNDAAEGRCILVRALLNGDYCTPDGAETFCGGGLKCIEGQCRKPPSLGELCMGICEDGLTCARANIAQSFCVPFPHAGEPCGEGELCEEGLACRGGTCVQLPAAKPGEACNDREQRCEKSACMIAEGATSGTCPVVLADGEACVPDDRAVVCEPPAGCFDGTCQLPDAAMCE
jgi:hypothetical protein